MSDAPEPALDEAEAAAGIAVGAEAPESPESPTWADDEVLLGSVALAQRALLEVTAPETVGSVIGHVAEGEHVLSLHFAADLSGYPGWHWSVTLARVEDGEPTVLETELMPGERALLAPEWVPWSERLADYRAAQAAAAAEAAERGDGAEGGEPDDDETIGEPDLSDESDDEGFADDGSDDADDDDVFDGIDIDALADQDDDDAVDDAEDAADDAEDDDAEDDDED